MRALLYPSHVPLVIDVSDAEREDLFIAKLRHCQTIYDFSDPRAQFAQKEQKRRCLVEIVDYVASNKGVFTEAVYEPLFEMFSTNLFRALPTGPSNHTIYDQEDDEPFLEPAWPHLQIVYELLRKFIVSSDTDPKLVRGRINSRFVLSMVELFNSEDPREREYLKTILHRIYGKIMQPRPFIRRSIMNVFYRFVFETHRHNGIAELLEIIGSIINGFAVPLKDEHKIFLRRFLIPLHTPKGLPSYHVQLSFCITQFVEKEPELATDVVLGLVRHWPITHSRKEVLLLNELEELLELTQPDDFGPVIEVLFQRIALCIESPHFQVAERALFFWNNEYIVSLILYFRSRIVPVVYGALRRNVEAHWNPNVLSLSFNVQKLLCEMDEDLYTASCDAYERSMQDMANAKIEREARWDRLTILTGAYSSCAQVPSAHRGSNLTGDNSGQKDANAVMPNATLTTLPTTFWAERWDKAKDRDVTRRLGEGRDPDGMDTGAVATTSCVQ
jgi:serine/threonine-protein phosphatase 2A regulatory subunit B'